MQHNAAWDHTSTHMRSDCKKQSQAGQKCFRPTHTPHTHNIVEWPSQQSMAIKGNQWRTHTHHTPHTTHKPHTHTSCWWPPPYANARARTWNGPAPAAVLRTHTHTSTQTEIQRFKDHSNTNWNQTIQRSLKHKWDGPETKSDHGARDKHWTNIGNRNVSDRKKMLTCRDWNILAPQKCFRPENTDVSVNTSDCKTRDFKKPTSELHAL